MTVQITRSVVQQRLETARAAVRELTEQPEQALAALAMTPEWNGLDMLRHVWVWSELCARCLGDWLGSRDWILTFADEDQFNLEMVDARRHTTLAEIRAGLESAYAVYARTLDERSDAELAERAAAPWGEELDRMALIWEELGHDLYHLNALREALGTRA